MDLLVRNLETGQEETFELDSQKLYRKSLSVGQSPDCDVVLASPAIAPKHLLLWAGSNHKGLIIVEPSGVRLPDSFFMVEHEDGRRDATIHARPPEKQSPLKAGDNIRVERREFYLAHYALCFV